MDSSEKILDILFRRIPPERILRRVCEQAQGSFQQQSVEEQLKTFLRFAETTLQGYSEDEQRLFFAQLKQTVGQRAEELRIRESVFLPLADFGEEVLTIQGDEPLCRFSKVLRWREMYHLFGQDMIVCAYLAYHDIQFKTHRSNFAWPAVLQTDNNVLRQLLETGMAENHYHLKGSTQSFALAWCALMNDPLSIKDLPEEFSTLLQSVAGRGPADNILPIERRLEIAALVRSILFRALHRDAFSTKQTADGHSAGSQSADHCEMQSFCSRNAFRGEYLHVFDLVVPLINQARVLQQCYGMAVPLPKGQAVCLDYALETPIFRAAENSPYRILSGERCFLYRCFMACFRGDFTDFEQDLFYLYLLLKTVFRGEMIQMNQQVGFKNFARYQDRKDLAWREPYHGEACRMALNAPLSTGHVRHLEARLTPADTPKKMVEKVFQYDFGKRFADMPYHSVFREHTHSFDPELDAESFRMERHFYVMHFVKKRDTDPNKLLPFSLQCRHENLREDTKKRAIALAKSLSQYAYLCNRIRGIDSCSDEVDCRPEVFATAFRFLRNFCSEKFGEPSVLLPQPKHRLSVTYHAGEDFYDIADGLRAIDEAINFLDFQRGDRIGHALALGVDPLIHYQTKSMSVILPKQNYLDNLVWLLYRSRELGVRIDPQQYGIMQRNALSLMHEIYGHAAYCRSMTLQDYYCSMMLRGDDPQLYQGMGITFRRPQFYESQYDHWKINRNKKKMLDVYRNDRYISALYYCYHYGHKEKIRGAKAINVSITPDYIAVIRQVQDAMQRELERRGIIIECNPTSNVLIGTFGKYGKHPILRFNNLGLDGTADRRRSSCPQLHVCINTDDLGVFDTSLEFEYALLFRALSEQKDEDGCQRYSDRDILNYLRNIQEMGLQAVFPAPL